MEQDFSDYEEEQIIRKRKKIHPMQRKKYNNLKAEELLSVNEFRQMYNMPSGFFERRIWEKNRYRIRIRILAKDTNGKVMESKEFRDNDEVYGYLKEIGLPFDEKFEFCNFERFKKDSIKIAAQELGKAEEEIEKEKLRKEKLTQRGFRQMYGMPDGIFERKIWSSDAYRIRIKILRNDTNGNLKESRELRTSEAVHDYLKELGIFVNEKINFVSLERFQNDTIKISPQKLDEAINKAKLKLTQIGYRQMYGMPDGIFERKVWDVKLYRIRIKVLRNDTNGNLKESKELRNSLAVHDYLKEMGISVDENFKFCNLERFEADTIQISAQKSEKNLEPAPAEQEVKKEKKVNPAEQKSEPLLNSFTYESSSASQVANEGPSTSSKTSIPMNTKKEDFVLNYQEISDDESHSAITTLEIPKPSHSVTPTNSKFSLVNRLTKKGFIHAKDNETSYNRFLHMDPKCAQEEVNKYSKIQYNSLMIGSNEKTHYMNWISAHLALHSDSNWRSTVHDKLDAVNRNLSACIPFNDGLQPLPICDKNCAFRCPGIHDAENGCEGDKIWTKIHNRMNVQLSDKEENMESLQIYVENLCWKASAYIGLFEIKLSMTIVPTKKYIVGKGPICLRCKRRVRILKFAKNKICENCVYTIYQDFYYPNIGEPIISAPRLNNNPRTLYFLCGRKSGCGEKIKDIMWTNLVRFISQSEQKEGPFGGKNRPGFPNPWQVVGKFASCSSALAPLYMMSYPCPPTSNSPNILPLSRLADSIVANYYPNDTIVVAMSHPSNFCVGHKDLDDFIRELHLRGVPYDSVYFHYHGVQNDGWGIPKWTTIVNALSLRLAIRESLPRYGKRPATSAVLYAAHRAEQERQNIPKQKRNTIFLDDLLTYSEMDRMEAMMLFTKVTICAERECGKQLGGQFVLCCSVCQYWFHGICAQITREQLESMYKQNLVWRCFGCYTATLLNNVVAHILPSDVAFGTANGVTRKRMPITQEQGTNVPRKATKLSLKKKVNQNNLN